MSDDEQVLEFKIRNGFSIEKLSAKIVEIMQDENMDAILYLPGGSVLDIEKECTAEDIIEGYQSFLQSQIHKNPHSNLNEKPSLKPV